MNNVIQMNKMVEQDADGGLRVSSLTIAEGSGVEHRAVLQLIGNNTEDLEQFGQVAFQMRPGYNNAQVRIAMLNEQQSTLVMTYQRNTEQVRAFKLALVKAFFEMAKQLAAPARALTADEIVAQALQITTAKVRELEAKIEQDAGKVYYVDTMVAENDHHLFRTVASDLMVGEMELRWALVYAGWIYHDQQRRRNSKNELVTEHQWSEYAAKKLYFFRALTHQAPLFKGNVSYTLKITTPGVAAVGRLVEKILNEYPGTLTQALPLLEQRYNERKKAAS